VNLAFGSRTTLLELLALLEDVLGAPVQRQHVEPRKGDVRDSHASQDRLRALFPDVVPVPLEQGLAETLAWFRSTSR
jgi:UDP-glucose 4-epimerase